MAYWKDMTDRQKALVIRAIRNYPSIAVPSHQAGTARSLRIKDVLQLNDDGTHSLTRDAMWDLEHDLPARYGNGQIMAAWRESRTWFLSEIRRGQANLAAGRLDDDDPEPPRQLTLFDEVKG